MVQCTRSLRRCGKRLGGGRQQPAGKRAGTQKLDADWERGIGAEGCGDPVGFGDVQKAWDQSEGLPVGGIAAAVVSSDAPLG